MENNEAKLVRDLSVTATEADLVDNEYIPIDGSGGTKKLPGSVLAARSQVETLAVEISDLNSKIDQFSITTIEL